MLCFILFKNLLRQFSITKSCYGTRRVNKKHIRFSLSEKFFSCLGKEVINCSESVNQLPRFTASLFSKTTNGGAGKNVNGFKETNHQSHKNNRYKDDQQTDSDRIFKTKTKTQNLSSENFMMGSMMDSCLYKHITN